MNQLFENIIQGLLIDNYFILDDFINAEFVELLNSEIDNRSQKGLFKIASTGNLSQKIDESQRGDTINWIETTDLGYAGKYANIIDDFKLYLNQTCYLGLIGAEVHFASYAIGAFYVKHLDSFKANNKRKITIITYLNSNWIAALGGELVLYLDTGMVKILPIAGRMVCFESSKIAHEVLVSTKERRSLSGWLLQ